MTTWKTRKKKLRLLLAISVLFVALASCKPTERIVVNTQYIDRLRVDSVHSTILDSIHIHERGDTVFVNRFRNVYKYKLQLERDTIHITDTLRFNTVAPMPKRVEVPTRGFYHKFGAWSFWLLIAALAVFVATRSKWVRRIWDGFKGIIKVFNSKIFK